MRAWPHRSEAVVVDLPDAATVGDALAASGFALDGIAAVAVFGERVDPQYPLHDGDRVELLRPLQIDPKEARRRRAGKQSGPVGG
jgi:putative ubiquitin-RnfH superfamily antitoxin RatB of RatAB toxin-antitoxin module